MITELTKSVTSIIIAAGAWVFDIVGSTVEGIPTWITELGLPVAFLVAVIYALVSTNKALRSSESGRLADRDEFLKRLTDDAVRATESRERLRQATERQTEAFENLVHELQKRPCQLPKMRE